MVERSTETVVEISRKPSDCDVIVREALILQGNCMFYDFLHHHQIPPF
jgi:hypothetical protein